MEHTQIFKCLAGSRLYGTNNAGSDRDYKAVHLPTKREILLGRGNPVVNKSTGSKDSRNGASDVDVESFVLQRFLKLASDMQTIPVEMLFVANNDGRTPLTAVSWDANHRWNNIWHEIIQNRDKILSRNTKSFVGYCKGQAIRYSLRGSRLETFIRVHEVLQAHAGMGVKVSAIRTELEAIDGVKFLDKPQPGGNVMPYLNVFGRQVPETLKVGDAAKVYEKPIKEAGTRANAAREAGGMDCKALYHAVRIADEGISLFQTGEIVFPCKNLPLLRKIRSGEADIDAVLDIFDEKIDILEQIGAESPLAEAPDLGWIDNFVSEVYEDIIRAG